MVVYKDTTRVSTVDSFCDKPPKCLSISSSSDSLYSIFTSLSKGDY